MYNPYLFLTKLNETQMKKDKMRMAQLFMGFVFHESFKVCTQLFFCLHSLHCPHVCKLFKVTFCLSPAVTSYLFPFQKCLLLIL